jgi:DnaJ-class molecular chaperone
MTPAEIREIVSPAYFSVVCDSCHGRMFDDGVLCFKCHGEGRLLVAEERVTHISKKMVRSAFLALAAALLLVAAVISILR